MRSPDESATEPAEGEEEGGLQRSKGTSSIGEEATLRRLNRAPIGSRGYRLSDRLSS